MFARTNSSVLLKTTFNFRNLTYGCFVKNISLKNEFITKVALYTSLSSSFNPFGSQSFSPKTEENSSSTTIRTQINGVENDPFNVSQTAFSSNNYESSRQNQYGDDWERKNNDCNENSSPPSYQTPKNSETDYFGSAQKPSYETNSNFSRSQSFQKNKWYYNKSQQNNTSVDAVLSVLSDQKPRFSASASQKLIDAIDEHGENWEHISKKIYNDKVDLEKLKRTWDRLKAYHPLWTTKECLKLIDAVKACGEDWQKISIEWFDNKRSPTALTRKWKRMFKCSDSQYEKSPEKYQNKSNTLYNTNRMEKTSTRRNLFKAQQKIVDKNQLNSNLGRELSLQWLNIMNLFKQQATSLEIHFNDLLLDSSWTKKENSTLFTAIKKFGTKDWNKILECLPRKSLKNIQERCFNVLWEPQEVETFDKAFEQYGSDWGKISGIVGTRSPGQCWSYWRITTGNDILEPNPDNRENRVKLAQHANVFIQFPNEEISQMSFIRCNNSENFVPEETDN